jgi:hypothetical protein
MLYLVRLKELINNPASLDPEKEWLRIGEDKTSPILIYGKNLSASLIKTDSAKPNHFIDYFKAINKFNDRDIIPSIEEHFRKAPTLLHGEDHFDARRFSAKIYRKIEVDLSQWIDEFTKIYLSNFESSEVLTIEHINSFVVATMKRMIANEIDVEDKDLPDFPGEILLMFPRVDYLKQYDRKLKVLVDFIENKLIELGRDPNESWVIASLAVMGFEPITGALFYGLLKNPTQALWDVEVLMKASAPVSFIGRKILKDFSVDDLNLYKDQEIYICPHLVHLQEPEIKDIKESPSLAFGMGPHICPGKKISLITIKAFFDAWYRRAEFMPAPTNISMARDFILRPIK